MFVGVIDALLILRVFFAQGLEVLLSWGLFAVRNEVDSYLLVTRSYWFLLKDGIRLFGYRLFQWLLWSYLFLIRFRCHGLIKLFVNLSQTFDLFWFWIIEVPMQLLLQIVIIQIFRLLCFMYNFIISGLFRSSLIFFHYDLSDIRCFHFLAGRGFECHLDFAALHVCETIVAGLILSLVDRFQPCNQLVHAISRCTLLLVRGRNGWHFIVAKIIDGCNCLLFLGLVLIALHDMIIIFRFIIWISD